MKKAAMAVALGMSLCVPVQAQQDWRGLILQAFHSPTGTVDAVLEGPLAEQAKRGLQTTDDIRVRISTVGPLPQVGCKRMEVLMYIPGKKFPTTAGDAQEFRTGLQLNMCPDGRPPESGHAQ